MRQHGFLRAGCLALLALLLAFPAHAQEKRRVTLVALGDSLTAGYGLPGNAALPAVLERALKERGHDVEIVNAGVSGDTAAGGLERLDWSVPENARGVILALGANDMLRGLDPAQTRRTLDTIVTRLKARNVEVLLAGMYASRNLGPDYVARFDSIYPDLAKKHGLILYPFYLDGVAGQRNLNLPDGIHPNAEGVRTMVERMLPTVETFLARLKGV
jgi:acyl-CoA thioesterase-1